MFCYLQIDSDVATVRAGTAFLDTDASLLLTGFTCALQIQGSADTGGGKIDALFCIQATVPRSYTIKFTEVRSSDDVL